MIYCHIAAIVDDNNSTKNTYTKVNIDIFFKRGFELSAESQLPEKIECKIAIMSTFQVITKNNNNILLN